MGFIPVRLPIPRERCQKYLLTKVNRLDKNVHVDNMMTMIIFVCVQINNSQFSENNLIPDAIVSTDVESKELTDAVEASRVS